MQDADAAGSYAVEGAADEIVAPTGAGAAAKAPRKRKPLIDPECSMAFVRPDGRVEYSSSAGIRNLPLVRSHRDNFVASLEFICAAETARGISGSAGGVQSSAA